MHTQETHGRDLLTLPSPELPCCGSCLQSSAPVREADCTRNQLEKHPFFGLDRLNTTHQHTDLLAEHDGAATLPGATNYIQGPMKHIHANLLNRKNDKYMEDCEKRKMQPCGRDIRVCSGIRSRLQRTAGIGNRGYWESRSPAGMRPSAAIHSGCRLHLRRDAGI